MRASATAHYLAPYRQRRHACARGWRRHRAADAALRRGHRAPRRARCRCIRPAMCWARRRCGSNMAAASGWPRATTRPSPTAPARPSSRCRCDTFITETHLRPADLPLADAGRADRGDRRLVARQRGGRARVGAVLPMPSARRSASCTGVAMPAASGRSSCTARSSRSTPSTARRAWRCRRHAARRPIPASSAALLKRALVLAPPSAQGTPWMTPLRRLRRCLRRAAGCSCAARGAGAASTAAS